MLKEFLHSKDPDAEKSKTLTGAIDQGLLPEKIISEEMLLEMQKLLLQEDYLKEE